ncbi:MAG: tRNA (adenosine(37)-N6)-dimethylallyltransferase MiaA [Dehalococcoidia bacterium]
MLGATGTGKSDAAIAIAETIGGEVISTDAYQVYRGMDIGTAKVSAAERERVRHHLIDIVEPADHLTLARFLDFANAALDDVWSRGKLPVLAGGSGQYVWALIEGWQPPRVPPDLELRAELEAVAVAEGPEALHDRLAALDPEAASKLDRRNARRVIRALEVVMRTGKTLAMCQARTPIDADVFVIGLRLDREALYARLDARVDAMIDAGFIAEVEALRAAGYGASIPVLGGTGYREIGAYLDGEYDLEEAVRRMKNAHHRLVRRQAAWFRDADPRIHWLDAGENTGRQAVEAVQEWLAR